MTRGRGLAAVVLVAAGIGGTSMAQTNAPEGSTPAPAAKTWVDTLTVKGDVRFRQESIADDSKLNSSKETYTESRQRVRARLGVEAQPSDELKTVIRLSTGGTNPNSGNINLGDDEGKKEIRVDAAYIDYSFFGKNPDGVEVLGGKMDNPFITFPDDLVWDPDVTPEGMAVKGHVGNDFATLFGNGEYIWLQERSGAGNTILYGGQGALKLQFEPAVALTIGVDYYGYQNTKGVNVVDWQSLNTAYGNSTINGTVSGGTTNKAWASDFTPVLGFAQFEFPVFGLPASLYVQELKNVDATTSYDQGQMFGATLGKLKKPGSYQLGYSYAKLEKDATLGTLTDDDRWGGGTDGEGHKVFAKYQITKNLQAGLTYFVDKKTISNSAAETDYNRLQMDVMATF